MTIGNRRAAHRAPLLFLTGSAFMKNLPALQQHDLRRALHNEVHSRPPEAIADNTAVFCVVMLANDAERTASRQWLHQLLRDLQLPVPDAEANHLRLDLGNCRLRWELHTEFVSWTWMLPLSADMLDDTDLPSASDAVPAQWLAGLPGQCLMAMNLWVLQPTPVLEKRAEQRWLYPNARTSQITEPTAPCPRRKFAPSHCPITVPRRSTTLKAQLYCCPTAAGTTLKRQPCR